MIMRELSRLESTIDAMIISKDDIEDVLDYYEAGRCSAAE
jgi:hypothetical protein